MKSMNVRCIGISFFLATFAAFIEAHQTCDPPERPANGDYFEKKRDKFQLGYEITYNCSEGYTLMGKETSRCKQNGYWSNPTPFCDRKVGLLNSFLNDGLLKPNPNVTDGNFQTCSTLTTSTSMNATLRKRATVFAVRIFFEQSGIISIEVTAGTEICKEYKESIGAKQWILLKCKKTSGVAKSIQIQNKSGTGSIRICEIEVYAKEEDDCDEPPHKSVPHGYFQVSRAIAELICEEGYKSDDNTRLACENNKWIETNKFECTEILCDPKLKAIKAPGTDWTFPDGDRKISVGTRRQLKCRTGYQKVGSPDIIFCLKDETWTKTNATCKEEKTAFMKNTTLIIIIVGVIVVLIMLALIGTTIYFVKKQRGNREVVVVYNSPPTEGSVVSGSEIEYASGYYESIKDSTIVPATISKSTPPQMISDGYFLPADNKGYVLPYEPTISSR